MPNDNQLGHSGPVPTGRALVHFYPEVAASDDGTGGCAAVIMPDGTRRLYTDAAALWTALGAIARGGVPIGGVPVPTGASADTWAAVASALAAAGPQIPYPPPARIAKRYTDVSHFSPKGKPLDPFEGLDLD